MNKLFSVAYFLPNIHKYIHTYTHRHIPADWNGNVEDWYCSCACVVSK